MIKIKLTQAELDRITSVKDFKEDINIGEIGENMTKQYLEQKGLVFVRKSEDRKDLKKWDLEFVRDEKPIKFEIKNDVFIIPDKVITLPNFNTPIKVKGKDTKNIFIEFHSRGVPSGISTTTADVWVNCFFHLNQMWFAKVDELKKLIEDNTFPISEDSGDIGSNTKGYLIPRFEYQHHFKVIDYEREII